MSQFGTGWSISQYGTELIDGEEDNIWVGEGGGRKKLAIQASVWGIYQCQLALPVLCRIWIRTWGVWNQLQVNLSCPISWRRSFRVIKGILGVFPRLAAGTDELHLTNFGDIGRNILMFFSKQSLLFSKMNVVMNIARSCLMAWLIDMAWQCSAHWHWYVAHTFAWNANFPTQFSFRGISTSSTAGVRSKFTLSYENSSRIA